MRCGISMTVMNYSAWPAFDHWEQSGEWVDPPTPDSDIVREDIELGILAEELGFDSLWTVEHHGTPYNMVTNTVQWLTYFAGATSKVDVGTMVVVLPWHHHPVRVAEDLAMLHNVLGEDRRLLVGLGRGAARREFRAMQIPMDESRGRFLEAHEIIKRALSQDVFEFEGEYFEVPSMSIRPQPRKGSELVEDMYCAWGSAQTIPIAAEAGLKPLVIAQKGWEEYVPDLAQYGDRRAAKGYGPARPIICLTVYCAETGEKAREGAQRYFTEYADAAVRNYELHSGHFGKTKGYEGYPDEDANREEMSKQMGKMWVDNHVWGTPEQCLAKIRWVCDLLEPAEIVCLPKVGSMDLAVARESLALFAKEVLPAVHELELTARV